VTGPAGCGGGRTSSLTDARALPDGAPEGATDSIEADLGRRRAAGHAGAVAAAYRPHTGRILGIAKKPPIGCHLRRGRGSATPPMPPAARRSHP